MREPGRLIVHLRSARVKLTSCRIEVYQRFVGAGPISMHDVIGAGIATTSAYRTIHLFLKIGVLQEVEPGLYELTDRHRQHHHYKLCRVCGKRTGFNNAALERAINRLDGREKGGFALEEHSLEITGVCARCREHDQVKPRQAIGKAYLRQPGA